MSPKFKKRLCLRETGRGEREEKGFVTAPGGLCVSWKLRSRKGRRGEMGREGMKMKKIECVLVYHMHANLFNVHTFLAVLQNRADKKLV